MVTGISCTFSTRFCAVTMTSSRTVCCAWAATAKGSASTAKWVAIERFKRWAVQSIVFIGPCCGMLALANATAGPGGRKS